MQFKPSRSPSSCFAWAKFFLRASAS